MRLSELKTGEKGVIVKVLGHGGFRKRIVEMGFVKGKTVEVLLNAPLRDPVKYKIMGYEISLRHQEAEMIEIISEDEAKQMKNDFHGSLTETIQLTDEKLAELAKGKRRTINVALVGNPNCGKTSLFNLVSGANEHVGNYSGVTVDAKEAFFDFQGYRFRLVDLPGTYSLSAYSPEEIYVRKHIIEEMPDIIINVVDGSNLERNLYLTTQLIDMNVMMVMALNMYDELENSGNKLNYEKLGELIGVPVVPTVGRTGAGIEKLFHIIIECYEGSDYVTKNIRKQVRNEVMDDMEAWHKDVEQELEHADEHGFFRHIHVNHGPVLEKSITDIQKNIAKNETIRHKYSTRFLSIKLLENDKQVEGFVRTLPNADEILAERDRNAEYILKTMGEDSEQAITDAKYGFIAGALKETFTASQLEKEQTTRVIDSIVTHRIWGYPIFMLFLYIMFEGTFVLGEYPMMGIEWLVEQLGVLVGNILPDGPLKDLIIDGILGGVGGVIVFLPNILILYFFISMLEDSGYMARAAFIMDKIMHRMGLHGKSFIPLIMGFGCNVPAIMATRMIEDRKCRLITMLVNPLMSCSARLPIYLVMIGTFFPKIGSLVLLGIYTTGILLAVLMARLFSKVLMKGADTPFVMELPPYRIPTGKTILRHTWEKGAQYLKKMGGIIMIASILIWFLGYYPNPEAYTSLAEQQEHSYIGQLGKAIEPVIAPLGFDWKLGIGLLSGIGAKELVVSTISVLYPDGMPITPTVALAYMLFVLIYFPCVATLVAIKNESGGWKWAIFSAFYTTALAWVVAFIVNLLGSL